MKSIFPSSIDLLLTHLKEKGINLAQLAKETGLYPQILYNWKNGKAYPSFELIEPICDFLRIDKDQMKKALYYDQGQQAYNRVEQRHKSGTPMRRAKSVKLHEQFSRLLDDTEDNPTALNDSIIRNLVPIPIILKPQKRREGVVREGVMGYVALPKEVVDDIDSLFAINIDVSIDGDFGISPGDLVIINQKKTLQDGNIVLVSKDDQLSIRRVFIQDDNVILTSALTPIIVKRADVSIIGCIVYSIKKY